MSTLRKLCSCVVLAATASTVPQASAIVNPGQPQVEPITRAVAPTDVLFNTEVISPTILTSYSDSQPLAVPTKPWFRFTPRYLPGENPELQQWDTTDTDATATWPDAADPVRQLPMAIQVKFACIRYHESRNHLNSVNITSGAGGWYQFTPYIWGYAVAQLPGLPASIAQATGDQQSEVAVFYYKRNSSLYPEWGGDAGVCNL